MKSNKQRRKEIKAIRAKRSTARTQVLECDVRFKVVANAIQVNHESLGCNCSYGEPEFMMRGYYLDKHFTCKECGISQTWTATQQKWWYEEIKGDVWTTAIRCRPCRKKEAARKASARQVHVEGLRMKREGLIKQNI